MVRILSTGEIVADDDPRARSPQQNVPQQAPSHRRGPRAPQTLSPSANDGAQHGQNQAPFAGRTNEIPLLESLNNKLLELGIPRIPLGYDIVVDPIYSVMILILLLVFGLPGLLLVGLIFLIKQLSRQDNRFGQFLGSFLGLRNTPTAPTTNTPGTHRPAASANDKKGKFSGTGNRLGS